MGLNQSLKHLFENMFLVSSEHLFNVDDFKVFIEFVMTLLRFYALAFWAGRHVGS